MRKLLFLLPDLRYGRPVSEVRTLADNLPAGEYAVEVIALGGGPGAAALAGRGVSVHTLPLSRWLDLVPLLGLRRLLRAARPDVVHVYGLQPLRALRLTAPDLSCPVVLSHPLPARERRTAANWVDCKLLATVAAVAASGEAQAQEYERRGVPAGRLAVVPPGVSARTPSPAARDAERPVVLCVGPLERERGLHDAIWGFDIVIHLYPEAQLWLVGEGPDLPRLRKFRAGMRMENVVRFLGPRDDLGPLLDRADLVWVPSRANCGDHTLLEAMASGKPVVASDVPVLAGTVSDGETGLLVPPGGRMQFARATRKLLEDPARAAKMGQAAARFVRDRRTPTAAAARWHELYRRCG